jgi:mRNA interferase MazF
VDLMIDRFDVYLVHLDPAVAAEMRKPRPCVVVSPDEMHRHLRTALIAPMTTTIRSYPTRVRCKFSGKQGEIACDQIRAVDHSRLVKRLGRIDGPAAGRVSRILVRMFS